MGFAGSMGPGMCSTLGPIDITKMFDLVIIPMPCMDIGFWITSDDPCELVVITGLFACNLITIICVSPIEDFVGELGGLVSSTIISEIEPLMGNPLLLLEGLPATDQGITMTIQNEINAPGDYIVPSQAVVLLA